VGGGGAGACGRAPSSSLPALPVRRKASVHL